MNIEILDGQLFKQMILQAMHHLTKHKENINALNVFPVPDGDTGTNMQLTFSSGANEVKSVDSDKIGDITKRLAKGLLMGARGNSGVILSQLFRGFAKDTETKDRLNAKDFASALKKGVETAYQAVMKPVEGTILTVAKDAANKAANAANETDNITQVMKETLEEARASLQRTPDLLPILKEVGVVDSGGQGLVYIYEAFLAVLEGKAIDDVQHSEPSLEEMVRDHHENVQSQISADEITYGYCTEFMIKRNETAAFDEQKYREKLSEHGDSLLVISDEQLVKVHIHTEYPGEVLTYSQTFGELINIKIENMREQHAQIVHEEKSAETKNEERKRFGIITVAAGEGLIELLKSLGATVVIHGGQTMNPSTEDFLNAIQQANAEKIFILPNNGNIILAAQQAAEVSKERVAIIPTKTIPQGIASLFVFNEDVDFETNERVMANAINQVKSGQVTYAVRDTVVNDVMIKKGDYLSIFEKEIVATSTDSVQALEKLLKQMIDDESELVTIIYGEDVKEAEVETIECMLENGFSELEYEIHEGNQPVYSFIVAVE